MAFIALFLLDSYKGKREALKLKWKNLIRGKTSYSSYKRPKGMPFIKPLFASLRSSLARKTRFSSFLYFLLSSSYIRLKRVISLIYKKPKDMPFIKPLFAILRSLLGKKNSSFFSLLASKPLLPLFSYLARLKRVISSYYRGRKNKPFIKPLFTILKSLLVRESSSLSLYLLSFYFPIFPSFYLLSYKTRPKEASFLSLEISRDKPFIKPLFAISRDLLVRENTSISSL